MTSSFIGTARSVLARSGPAGNRVGDNFGT